MVDILEKVLFWGNFNLSTFLELKPLGPQVGSFKTSKWTYLKEFVFRNPQTSTTRNLTVYGPPTHTSSLSQIIFIIVTIIVPRLVTRTCYKVCVLIREPSWRETIERVLTWDGRPSSRLGIWVPMTPVSCTRLVRRWWWGETTKNTRRL